MLRPSSCVVVVGSVPISPGGSRGEAGPSQSTRPNPTHWADLFFSQRASVRPKRVAALLPVDDQVRARSTGCRCAFLEECWPRDAETSPHGYGDVRVPAESAWFCRAATVERRNGCFRGVVPVHAPNSSSFRRFCFRGRIYPSARSAETSVPYDQCRIGKRRIVDIVDRAVSVSARTDRLYGARARQWKSPLVKLDLHGCLRKSCPLQRARTDRQLRSRHAVFRSAAFLSPCQQRARNGRACPRAGFAGLVDVLSSL